MAIEEPVFTLSSYSITTVTDTTVEIEVSGSWITKQINGNAGDVTIVSQSDPTDTVTASVTYASYSGTTTATITASSLTPGTSYSIAACTGYIFYDQSRFDITSEITFTTTEPVDDKKYLNKRGLAHYDEITKAREQEFSIGQGSVSPVFDGMAPVRTIEWNIATANYRPIYTIANTGLTYMNLDATIAYRITVTGTNIHQVMDVVDHWHNPINYPISSVFMRTLSTAAATTGIRYLRAVYPTSSYLNNSTYPLGMEIYPYNSTSRHIKIEVFKDNSIVTWNTSLASSSIYVNSTYNGYNSIETYTNRGWKFRQPLQMYASSAGSASYMTDFESVNTAASELKTGATALVAGHYAYLADDGLVYDISNKTKNIAMGESKVGFINSAVAANTAISYTYWRAISRPNATQVGYISHGTLALGNRVFLRCTLDSSGNVHSDNYLSTTMSAGYTWMPFGWARSTTTLYVDTRFPKFYTLDSNGKLTHIDGKEIAGGGGSSYTAGDGIKIENGVISLDLTNANNVSY